MLKYLIVEKRRKSIKYNNNNKKFLEQVINIGSDIWLDQN